MYLMRFSKKELCNFGNLEKFTDLPSNKPEVASKGGKHGNKYSSPSFFLQFLLSKISMKTEDYGSPTNGAT